MKATDFQMISAAALLMLLAWAPGASAAAGETQQPAITDRIADGVYRVAMGEPAIEEKKAAVEVVTPDASSPALYGQGVRNFYRTTDPDHWIIMNTLPGWVPAMTGSQTVKGVPMKVDLGLDDIYHLLTHYLDYVIAMNVEARRGRVSLFTDIMYMKMSGRFSAGTTLPPLLNRGPGIDVKAKGDFKFTSGIYELGGGYRFLDRPWGGPDSKKKISMDVIAGARYYRVYSQLNVNAKASIGPIAAEASAREEGAKNWVDPFIGLRLQADLTEKIFFYLRGDVGGFGIGRGVSSDFAWKAQAGMSYNPTPRISLFAGYQVLDVNYHDGDFGYDIRQMGPVIGATYAIGGNPPAPAGDKKVAEAK